MRTVVDHAARAIVELALHAVSDVLDRNVDPLALGADCRGFFAVLHLLAPLLSFHDGHQQGLGRLRILVDVRRAQTERFFRVLVPQFAGGQRGVSDLLMDELQIPRLTDAERVHGADLHVRHHLRRGYNDGLDVLVGIDAASRQPVANPQIVGASRKRHRRLDGLTRCFFLLECRLERRGIDADLQVAIFLGHRDALAVQVQPRHDVHRRRHVVLRHLAGRNEIGHRRQDVCAIDAVAFRSQHQIVTGGAPRRLLLHLDIGHAVFGEDALLLGDKQRRSVGQRDEAELGALHFRPRSLRKCAAWKVQFDRGQQRGRAGAGLDQRAPIDAAAV